MELANRMTAAVDRPLDHAANVGSARTGREMSATGAVPARRLADALVEIARRILNQGDWLPTQPGAAAS
jgi:hypothetical protein